MNVLVLGGGGREHALVWKIAQSPMVKKVVCAPGNGGISTLARCVDVDVTDTTDVLDLAKREKIDLVVVGPELPLASGVVDAFQPSGIPIFGPTMAGAMMETSKIFAKELMAEADIPTADFRIFSAYRDAVQYVESLSPPYVIKADGLAAGKGAYVIRSAADGQEVLKEVMVNRVHGSSGDRVIVESFLPGVEASYLAFTDGSTIVPLTPSQDHKPLLDNDQGPNTGGMGAYTPIPFLDRAMERDIDERIMRRAVEGLRSRGIVYKGVLYGGLMITAGKPFVIEFNARLGDPETQPILFKMESDIVPLLIASVEGSLDRAEPIRWKEGVSVCVVMASAGYPHKAEKGKTIEGLENLEGKTDIMVFHAATKRADGKYYTSGGRVLGVTAIGETYEGAIKKVYEAVSCIRFEGMQYRTDIGMKAIKRGGNNE